MEDTLRASVGKDKEDAIVLILVLMEDTLRGMQATRRTFRTGVLILVLMEDTLRGAAYQV